MFEFQYKENRTYIHGPDLFNAMYIFFQNKFGKIPTYSGISIRKMAKNQITISDEKILNKPCVAIFEASTKLNNLKLFLYESDRMIKESTNYHEDDIIKNAQFKKKSAEIKNYNRYTISEISVALLKAICNKEVSNRVKWIFVDIVFKDKVPLKTSDKIKISLEKNIGTKMIVGKIEIENRNVGKIKFSSK